MQTTTTQYMRVEQMASRRGTHNPVPNQFVIHTKEGKYFQSYATLIAFRSHSGKVTLDRDSWDYSKTTGLYRNIFLGEGISDTRKKIASGEYRLENLNA